MNLSAWYLIYLLVAVTLYTEIRCIDVLHTNVGSRWTIVFALSKTLKRKRKGNEEDFTWKEIDIEQDCFIVQQCTNNFC